LVNVNMYKAQLMNTELTNANLSNANMTKALLFSVELDETNLTGVKLIKAQLQHINFEDINLRDADLSGAKVQGTTKFKRAILCNTIMPDGKKDNSGCSEQDNTVASAQISKGTSNAISKSASKISGFWIPNMKLIKEQNIEDEITKNSKLLEKISSSIVYFNNKNLIVFMNGDFFSENIKEMATMFDDSWNADKTIYEGDNTKKIQHMQIIRDSGINEILTINKDFVGGITLYYDKYEFN
jgi:uncharacterized protein YjbI with pentapeptide repeats